MLTAVSSCPGYGITINISATVDGALDLANGVTSARDMANDTDSFSRSVSRALTTAASSGRAF